jgi:hypothetical protein
MSKVTRMVAKRERDERRARSDMAVLVRNAGKEAAARQTAKGWPNGFVVHVYSRQRRVRLVLTEITCMSEVLYLGEDGALYDRVENKGTLYLRVNLVSLNDQTNHQQYMEFMEKAILELQYLR